jgi:hypothetical protein
MQINIQNVEELIFQNKEVWLKMPDLIHLRDQWRISRMTPMLRAMGKKCILDFLRNAKGVHEDMISEYFGTHVTIDKIERHLVHNAEFSVEDDNVDLELQDNFTGFSTFRKEGKVGVTFWR